MYAAKMPATLLSRHVPHKREEIQPRVLQVLLHPVSHSQGCKGCKKGHSSRNSKKRVRRIKKLKARVRKLKGKKYDCKDCKRYVKRLKREIGSLFTFVLHDAQYHNGNISERMLMAFAEARKVLYGSRTKKGADRTAIMMSLHATCTESIFMILPKSVWQEKQI